MKHEEQLVVKSASRTPRSAQSRESVQINDPQYVNLGNNGSNPRAKQPAVDLTGRKASDAPELFWKGYSLYGRRDYTGALSCFEGAIKLSDNDARYWYFRALVERALGDAQAQRSLERAVQLQREGKPGDQDIGLALERVQGTQRQWIRSAQDARK